MSAPPFEGDPAGPLVSPVAGVGGSLYDTIFPFETYPNALIGLATFRSIDNWANTNLKLVAIQGLAAGLVWTTLVYLLTLTPTRKKGTPFHTFIIAGIICMIVKLMMQITMAVTPGMQISSAYTGLTGDVADSAWPTNFIAAYAITQITAWFAFSFAAICMWIQAKGLMIGLKVQLPYLYNGVLAYLGLTAVAALATSMAFSILQLLQVTNLHNTSTSSASSNASTTLDNGAGPRLAYLVSYAICIGSFSMVSMFSVCNIIYTRPMSIVTKKSNYASALNIVGLFCVQSSVIPFVFCILQLVPRSTLVHTEILLLPSVYMVLPLGSLFMTVSCEGERIPMDIESPRIPGPSPSKMSTRNKSTSPIKVNDAASERTCTNSHRNSMARSFVGDGGAIQRELTIIDRMDGEHTSARKREVVRKSGETETALL